MQDNLSQTPGTIVVKLALKKILLEISIEEDTAQRECGTCYGGDSTNMYAMTECACWSFIIL